MTRKRVFLLLFVAASLLLILFLRELGILDSNLYKSRVATDRVTTSSLTAPTESGPSVSYNLNISYDGEHISSSSLYIAGKPTLDINVDLIPSVSGNYWTPLYKSFTVEFSTSFESSAQEDSRYRFEGNINGSTQITIIGFCTRRKALELARDEIVRSSQDSLLDKLNTEDE